MCFNDSLCQHTEWHKKAKKNAKQFCAMFSVSDAQEETKSEYDVLLGQAFSNMQASDLLGAKKVFRKAVKVNPRGYTAYGRLGDCFFISGNNDEAMFYYAEYCKMAAVGVLLRKESVADWARIVHRLCHHYISRRDVVKPKWWCNSIWVEQVTWVALAGMLSNDNTLPYELIEMTEITVDVLTGCVRRGISFKERRFENVRREQIMEASLIYDKLADKLGQDDRAANYRCQAETLKQRGESTPRDDTIGVKPGCWCFIRAVGRPFHNKVGLVTDNSYQIDNLKALAMKVDGFDGLQVVPGRCITCLPDFELGLIACMAEEDQWHFVRILAQERFLGGESS